MSLFKLFVATAALSVAVAKPAPIKSTSTPSAVAYASTFFPSPVTSLAPSPTAIPPSNWTCVLSPVVATAISSAAVATSSLSSGGVAFSTEGSFSAATSLGASVTTITVASGTSIAQPSNWACVMVPVSSVPVSVVTSTPAASISTSRGRVASGTTVPGGSPTIPASIAARSHGEPSSVEVSTVEATSIAFQTSYGEPSSVEVSTVEATSIAFQTSYGEPSSVEVSTVEATSIAFQTSYGEPSSVEISTAEPSSIAFQTSYGEPSDVVISTIASAFATSIAY
ncbi:hypothetical protein BD410DRAFT_158477 [Rickenella mellea]|uniref:Uncharacterized protein n=1 Tax=Rickenella mellea TaxID=50990 RepID=A0A4Y7Q8F3_9AGAM|nr:hypothetical protein BD410DRAFT_158477 [Rickenella mellea]